MILKTNAKRAVEFSCVKVISRHSTARQVATQATPILKQPSADVRHGCSCLGLFREGRMSRSRLTAETCGGNFECAFESTVERSFGLIAHFWRDLCH
jgi:hypothetical protein